MFISSVAKGLSNRLPFFGCTITRQFNIRGLYQRTLIQLSKSNIIKQSNKKGLINSNPFYHWTGSYFQQQRTSTTDYLYLAALLPSNSTSEGLISKPSYSWANLLLSNSPTTMGSINSKPSHIVIHNFCSSRPHQAKSPHFAKQSIFFP